ncbi:MAG: biotin--[acetyl-CoA-carboxylase] ligase [Rikenellaceae bacterium]
MQFRIFKFQQLSSTNDQADDSKYCGGDIIVADYQNSGRGQRGNRWQSRGGENLLFSLVLEPEGLRAMESFVLSEVTALAISQTLIDFGVEGVEIKWPNDILVGGRKIAGILIENSLCGEYVSRSVVGVGLNVLQRNFSMVTELEATSMVNQGATVENLREVLGQFCENFARIYCEYTSEELHHYYRSMLYRREGYWRYRDNKVFEDIEARYHSIDFGMGVLTLELRGGELRSYYFKEVSYLS